MSGNSVEEDDDDAVAALEQYFTSFLPSAAATTSSTENTPKAPASSAGSGNPNSASSPREDNRSTVKFKSYDPTATSTIAPSSAATAPIVSSFASTVSQLADLDSLTGVPKKPAVPAKKSTPLKPFQNYAPDVGAAAVDTKSNITSNNNADNKKDDDISIPSINNTRSNSPVPPGSSEQNLPTSSNAASLATSDFYRNKQQQQPQSKPQETYTTPSRTRVGGLSSTKPTPTVSATTVGSNSTLSPIHLYKSSIVPKSQSKETKRTIFVIVSSIICLFSVLNFWKEQKHGQDYMTQVRTHEAAYRSENFDLSLLEGQDKGLVTEEDLSSSSSSNNNNNNKASQYEALADYVPNKNPPTCPPGLQLAPIISNPEADASTAKRIPPIVHITGKSPCLTKEYYDGVLTWNFPNHSLYFHDEAAVDHLLFEREWPMFPQIKNAAECLKDAGGAAKADLWRYLVTWEYGGIYTDMDNLPGRLFNATTVNTTIKPDMDAFFLQEGGGWISQFFFAVAPKHPLMFYAVHDVLHEMHGTEDTGAFYVPATTGPGATKRAFLRFMGVTTKSDMADVAKYSKPSAGLYQGVATPDWTVNVEGSRQTGNSWLLRSAVSGKVKEEGWKQMNMTHYQALKRPTGKSCFTRLHEKYNPIKIHNGGTAKQP